MKIDTYFKKYGEVYGIEQPSMACGYATNCVRFTDFLQAKTWASENTNTYRYLGTKADSVHLGKK